MKMKSKKNLTRFTYETTAFQGWRLNISRAGTTFTKYFSDKKFGGQRKAFKVADDALSAIKDIVDNARRVNGKLSNISIKKVEKILAA